MLMLLSAWFSWVFQPLAEFERRESNQERIRLSIRLEPAAFMPILEP